MKAKLQLDAKSIQAFLLTNVEKIGLAVVALLGLFIVYRAISGVERYSRPPEQLQQEVRRGEQAIKDTPLKVELTPPDYPSLAQKSRVPIKDAQYATPIAWDPPLWSKRKLRENPPVFAVSQLCGTGELGAVSMSNAQATGGPRENSSASQLQRWVVITGIVPLKKQEEAYDEALKRSVYYDSKNDYPQYLDYQVQRLEVPGPGEATNLDWSKAKTFTFKKEKNAVTSRWASKTDEVVAADNIDSSLTFPLAPLVGRQWGKSATHPDIPMLDRSQIKSPGGPGRAGGRVGASAAPAPMSEPGFTPASRENGSATGSRENASRQPSPYDDEPDSSAPANEPAKDSGAEKAAGPAALGVRLLRYFDFSVEPGKYYVYRVRLALANPNYIPKSASSGASSENKLKESYLKDPALAHARFSETDWSEPSPVISTPTDARLLALAANAVKGTADILVAKWSRPGFEAFHEFTVVRGQIANFADSTFTHAQKRYKVNYYSNAIAVDYRGGEKLSHRGNSLTAPGEVLLMEADGSLSVRSEADDKGAIEQLKAAEAHSATSPAAGKAAVAPAGATPRKGLETLVPPSADPKKKAPKAK
ncbi:MAG: hypothetical protein LLG00_16835 [Planctomycetaceae bacterium]|nr:hypothetical protein [Planctomycetaceae bacterium]